MEGSPLGHAFYQLRLLGVDVESAMEYLLEPKRRKFHRKLVRDLIPTSIRAQGEKVDFRQLRGRELTAALLRKLVEEALEVRAASSRTALREELADIYEVLSALARNSGITPEEIASLADRKRTEKGGFEVGYELVATGGAGATTPGEYRKSLHIRGKSEGQRATIPIPLVPPPEGAGRDQLRITIGDVSIRVSLVYKGDHVEVRLDSDREVVDDRQLELFDK